MREICFLKNIYLFIWLCQVLVVACTWDLVPWPGMEPGPPTLGAQSLNCWTTREITKMREIFVDLYANGKDPVERRKLTEVREKEHYWGNVQKWWDWVEVKGLAWARSTDNGPCFPLAPSPSASLSIFWLPRYKMKQTSVASSYTLYLSFLPLIV